MNTRYSFFALAMSGLLTLETEHRDSADHSTISVCVPTLRPSVFAQRS
jgi:hypothetical protein